MTLLTATGYHIFRCSHIFRTLDKNARSEQFFAVLLLLAVVLLTAIFETAQQLYYINRYQLVDDVTFTGLFKFQALRWVIWLFYAYVLYWFCRRYTQTEHMRIFDLGLIFLVIVGLVVLNVLTIPLVQMLIYFDTMTWQDYWQESVPFYAYQKAPIYTLAYIAFAIIVIFYRKNKQLQVEVLKLGELKQSHSELYQHLSRSYADQVSVLSLKVGTKQKIIPTDSIRWIEADDYCVNVYTDSSTPDSMRTSLKALEKQLGPHFLRVHRGAIVNMNNVHEISASKNSHVKLTDGTTVNVAQSKLKMVREYIAAQAS